MKRLDSHVNLNTYLWFYIIFFYVGAILGFTAHPFFIVIPFAVLGGVIGLRRYYKPGKTANQIIFLPLYLFFLASLGACFYINHAFGEGNSLAICSICLLFLAFYAGYFFIKEKTLPDTSKME